MEVVRKKHTMHVAADHCHFSLNARVKGFRHPTRLHGPSRRLQTRPRQDRSLVSPLDPTLRVDCGESHAPFFQSGLQLDRFHPPCFHVSQCLYLGTASSRVQMCRANLSRKSVPVLQSEAGSTVRDRINIS